MPEGRTFHFKLDEEVDRFFDDSSLASGAAPCLVVVMGAPCVGKTTFRREQLPAGHVVLDAGEIFLHLSRGDLYPFPGAFQEPMELMGRLVARRAVSERRHIVMELIGAEAEPLEALLKAMKAIGYKTDLKFLECPIEETIRRNETRGPDSISCYYAEPFHRRWLLDAATEALPH
jgi:hypothetical protein